MARFLTQQTAKLGVVGGVDAPRGEFQLRCRSGDTYVIHVSSTTWVNTLANLDGYNRDRTPDPEGEYGAAEKLLRKHVREGRLIQVVGVRQEHEGRQRFDAYRISVFDDHDGKYLFESTHWWLMQLISLGDDWLEHLFGGAKEFDFRHYRTSLGITGLPDEQNRVQECATLSRLIYGLASAYLLTGSQRFLDAAQAGVTYQREHFRSYVQPSGAILWAHGKDGQRVVFPSQFGDDQDSIPLYEQIYALAGLTQYYRITLDWETLDDIRRTVRLFQQFFRDTEQGGYFSHVDYATMDAHSPHLERKNNRSRKNWNSIGDHIPAYLINLLLALDPLPKGSPAEDLRGFVEECWEMLRETSCTIVERFPESDDAESRSPFVRERFHRDWTADLEWGWQQDRAIVGHNLKIAWNLSRVAIGAAALERNSDQWKLLSERTGRLADRLGREMVEVGVDQHRGGIYDAVERHPSNGMPYQFPWLNTKDFWQQEQAILAYLILYGRTKEEEYLELSREMMAHWNLNYLDHDETSIYFRVLDIDEPYLKGDYRDKGGHSISGYHSFELCFLAHIYIRTYVARQPFRMFFRPDRHCGQQSINVLPDFFPQESLRVRSVTVNGVSRTSIDPTNFRIELAPHEVGSEIQVEFEPTPEQRPTEDVPAVGQLQRPQYRGKIGVLTEAHFDDTEFQVFNREFPKHGFEVEYVSRLWANQSLEFAGNDHPFEVRCTVARDLPLSGDSTDEERDTTRPQPVRVQPEDYVGVIMIGGYAMDRLRYEANPHRGRPSQAPAVEFMRQAFQNGKLKIGSICHGLWLLTGAGGLLHGRRVTCAHNILYDVQNAGAEVIFREDGGTVDTFVDGNLITGKHPGVVHEFMKVFLRELGVYVG